MKIKYSCEIAGRFLRIASYEMPPNLTDKIIHYIPMDKIQALTIENNTLLHVKTGRYVFAVNFVNEVTCQKSVTDILQYIEELPHHIHSELEHPSQIDKALQ
jgi:hypothetical protein